MNYFSVDSREKIPAKTHFIKLLSTGHGKKFLVSKHIAADSKSKKSNGGQKFEIITGFPDLQGLDIWNHHETHLPAF